MIIAVGSTNAAKVLAVKEVLQDTTHFSKAIVRDFDVNSDVSTQPMSLQETILGAKNRAKHAFNMCDCQYSFGIESGLMQASETLSGYLHLSACCIYDGINYYTGLSTAFEIPPKILKLVVNEKMDLAKACLHSGITNNTKIGSTEGLIGILTKGKVDRKEFSKQCIRSAVLQLENHEWYASHHKPSAIKAIIFDCDGTLVNSEREHYLAWQGALQEKGHYLTKEFYINHFSGQGDFEISKMTVDILGENLAEELLSHKHKLFDEYSANGISPIEATVAFAKRLFEQKEKLGLKLAVASGARREEIIRHLKHLNIEHYFDVILSGKDDVAEYKDPEGTNKPKPYVYLKTAKMLGMKPEECAAIEDSHVGVTSAVAANCFTIAIPNPYTHQHDISQAHMKIDSFADLTVDEFFKMMPSK